MLPNTKQATVENHGEARSNGCVFELLCVEFSALPPNKWLQLSFNVRRQ